MKKLLILLLATMMVGCSSNVHPEKPLSKPVDTINDIQFFDTLKEEDQKKLMEINRGYPVENFVFDNIGTPIPDFDLKDINGESINLTKFKGNDFILEIVSDWCHFCSEQSATYTDEILKKYPDIHVVQYFAKGNPEDVKAFYKTIEKEIPENITVIPENAEFTDFLINERGIDAYPNFLMYDETGTLGWINIGMTSADDISKFYDYAFDHKESLNEIQNKDGKQYSDVVRTWIDVKEDFDREDREKIGSLSSQLMFESSFYGNYGTTLDINGKELTSDINDEKVTLQNRMLLHFFSQSAGREDYSNIEKFNKFYSKHEKDLPLLNVIISSTGDAKQEYKDMKVKPKGDIISNLLEVPEDLYKLKLYNDPSVVYIEDGIVKGVWVGEISSAEALEELYQICQKY